MILKPLSWIWTTPDETLEIAIPGDYDCREAIANGRDHGVGSTCGEQVAYESNVVTAWGEELRDGSRDVLVNQQQHSRTV
jgi:hypothetical protein